MDEAIEVSLERVRTIIEQLDPNRFSTADVIRGYCGGFFKNSATPPYYSFNAQFGKLLRRNEAHLGIEQIEADAHIVDDRDQSSTSSFWRRIG